MEGYTDKEKEQFLLNLIKLRYTQGDSYYAYKSKKRIWHFGYTNDYPLQHGKGENIMLPDGILNIIMNVNLKELI